MGANETRTGATKDETGPKQASITLFIRTNPEWTIVLFFGFFWAIAVVACPFYAPSRALVTLGLAFGASAVGAFPGFLFGLPKSTSATNSGSTGGDTSSLIPSTGLEQIADWLTKIIVGAGLVELKTILPWFGGLCTSIAAEYGETPPSPTFVGGWLLFFVVVGFFAAYNLTRVYLSPVYRNLEQLVRERIAPVARDRDRFLKRASALAAENVRALNPGAKFIAMADAEPKADESHRTATADDPNKGAFGGKSSQGHLTLSAKFLPTGPPGATACVVELAVQSDDPAKPLEGEVEFHLHPTFAAPVARIPSKDGQATMRATIWGGFTVGAITPDGTRLELDLSELPDAPQFVREL